MTSAKWDEYPNFTKAEFDCKHTGENSMQHEFMSVLQAIRTEYGKPMKITSGFRSRRHPIEARKSKLGEHPRGLCCDVACTNSSDRFELVRLALKYGITRIGFHPRFLHFGLGGPGLPPHVIWDYK